MKKQFPRAFWKGCSKSEVLFGMHTELSQLMLGLKGYATLLLKADLSECERCEVAQENLNYIESLESLLDSLNEYLQELRRLSSL